MEEDIPWNEAPKRVGVAILIPDKIVCNKRQRRLLYNIKEGNPTKGYNICKYLCTHSGSPKYIRQILTDLKREIDKSTVIVEDFDTLLSTIDRLSRQKNH